MTNQSINSTLHYSDIDEPLYFYNNSTLFESYKLKNVLSTNRLANISSDGKWEWNKNLDKTLFERRGNFFGKTLNAMTGHEPYMTFLPNAKELQQSEIIPDSFEVLTLKYLINVEPIINVEGGKKHTPSTFFCYINS